MPQTISVVVPVFEEAETIPVFLARLLPALAKTEMEAEVVFAVDPGDDGTERLLEHTYQSDSRIKMLLFSRRVGQATATIAGLEYATGDVVVTMDVDLQDSPELIPELVEQWRQGFDVVLAQRRNRAREPFTRTVLAKLGYGFMDRFAEVPIPRETGDFRLMSRRVVNELVRFKEHSAFLRGLSAWTGFRTTVVKFDRSERLAGKTKHSELFGSLRIGLNGVIGFSTALLNASVILGLISASIAVFVSVAYAVTTLIGFPFPVGNPTIVVSLYLLAGLIMISNGILGLYIGQIFLEVKGRPRFIVERSLGFD